MNDLGLFVVIIAMGAFQGFILSAILILIKDRNKAANTFLALFLFLISLTMVGRLLRELSFFEKYPNFLALPDAIIFLYGPLMYIYLRKLFVFSKLEKKNLVLLFTPALLFIISEIPLLFDENHRLRILWTKHTTLRFIFIEGSAIIHNIYFLILQIRLFSTYKKISDNNFSYKQYPAHLRFLYLLTGVTLFIWLLSYLSWVFGYYNVLSVIGYRIIWLILPFISYTMGYFAMKDSNFYKISIPSINSGKKKFSNSEKKELLMQLADVMTNKKLYKRSDFSLTLLSNTLSLDRNKLSQLINEEFKKNFNDWTNDYRINNAKILLTESDLSIKEIYYEVGFNSKSAFNRAFKNKLNTTPSEYRIEAQNNLS